MVRVALGLVALCGACFMKPGFSGGDDDHNGDAGVDARRDAPPGGYMDAPACTSIYVDTFTSATGGDPCQPWGALISGNNASVLRTNGELHMAGGSATMGTMGGCQSTAFSFANGASVELVHAPIANMYWQTWFELAPAGSTTGMTTQIRVQYTLQPPAAMTTLAMMSHTGTIIGSVTYAGGLEWLRFTKAGTSAVHGEYSSDGTTWQTFGDDVYPFVLDQVSVALRMGTYGMDSQYVAWDNLNTLTCPP